MHFISPEVHIKCPINEALLLPVTSTAMPHGVHQGPIHQEVVGPHLKDSSARESTHSVLGNHAACLTQLLIHWCLLEVADSENAGKNPDFCR